MYLAEGDLATNVLTLLLLFRLSEIQEERGLVVERPKNGLRGVKRRGDAKPNEVEPWRTAAIPVVVEKSTAEWNQGEWTDD